MPPVISVYTPEPFEIPGLINVGDRAPTLRATFRGQGVIEVRPAAVQVFERSQWL